MSEDSIKEIHKVGHIQLQATIIKLIDFFLPRLEFQHLYQHFICYLNKKTWYKKRQCKNGIICQLSFQNCLVALLSTCVLSIRIDFFIYIIKTQMKAINSSNAL